MGQATTSFLMHSVTEKEIVISELHHIFLLDIVVVVIVWVLLEHLLFLFIALVVYVLLILNIQLAALQVDVIYIEVILVELHVDHLLPFLVHLVFFEALVNFVNLISHFRLVLHAKKTLYLRLGCVQNLTRFDLVWLLVAQVEIYDGAADLN